LAKFGANILATCFQASCGCYASHCDIAPITTHK
jgi:hypothetical protein